MPYINGKLKTPDELIALGRCPETGIPLKGVHIEHHIARTWVTQPNADPSGDEPRRRIAMLREYAKRHPEMAPEYDDKGQLVEQEY